MNAAEFATKWIGNTNTERAAAQEHFLDICHMLGVPTPNTDREGESYAFEKGVSKTSGGDGWADVWLRGHFGWEYKGHHRDLEAAYRQLLNYREALENPPLLVVCDLDRFSVRTNFTSTVRTDYHFTLKDLLDSPAEPLRILRALFEHPEALRPSQTREQLTEKAAGAFAALAKHLRDAGHAPQQVAHFLNKLLFVLFAEDARLLPEGIIQRLGKNLRRQPAMFSQQLSELFRLMSTKPGGVFGYDLIQWFNGGLFDGQDVLPLTTEQLDTVAQVSLLDWSQIEPAIFGTLFERGLDPDKRSQLGAHYTDRTSIERIVYPVVVAPLEREWEALRRQVAETMEGVDPRQKGTSKEKTKALSRAGELVNRFVARLSEVRVLDPACGSGNFLYVALQSLKDLERRVLVWESATLQTTMRFPIIGPQNVCGIELNSFAAELARVTIWIGEIQWMIANGFAYQRDPVLRPLNNIECRDAVLDLSDPAAPREPAWPDADFIIGNPPFLGDRRMIGVLGEDYTARLREVYAGRVPGGADLVTYWFSKATDALTHNDTARAGFVSTNSIRGGANRKVLDRLLDHAEIFNAWSDEPWIVEGAAVRVSIICFASNPGTVAMLDGKPVNVIHADLTASTADGGVDVTKAKRLAENLGVAFIGTQKNGAFDIPGETARAWLQAPLNPNGRPNSDVVRPWANGMDITRRPSDTWIIDFGPRMPERDAALYQLPFQHVVEHVRESRINLRRNWHKTYWWLHGDPRPGLRKALQPFQRYIVTPRVSKYRLFVWMDTRVLPDSAVAAIACDDDTIFGILHSRFHELWALRLGTWLGVGNDPRYTPSTTFETFPFPDGLTPDIPASRYASNTHAQAIAEAARRLCELRDNWLNPPDLVQRVPEVVPGYPDRIIARNAAATATLKTRTLTNLYNERPAWLANAHHDLDAAVAAAYGWPHPLDDEEMLRRLLELNAQRAAQSGGVPLPTDNGDEDEE